MPVCKAEKAKLGHYPGPLRPGNEDRLRNEKLHATVSYGFTVITVVCVMATLLQV